MNDLKKEFKEQTPTNEEAERIARKALENARKAEFERTSQETRKNIQNFSAQYKSNSAKADGSDWQTPLKELDAIYKTHKPNEKDPYPVRKFKSDVRDIIHAFATLNVAENNPEAALEMLKNHHDNPSTPETVMEIGRAHAQNEQGTPHIALKAAEIIAHIYKEAKAGDSPEKSLTMKNAEKQIAKFCSRLISGSELKPPQPEMQKYFNEEVARGRKFDRAAVLTVPKIIEKLEEMDNGQQKLERLLRNRKEEVPGLPDYRNLMQEALNRIIEKKEAGQHKIITMPEPTQIIRENKQDRNTETPAQNAVGPLALNNI